MIDIEIILKRLHKELSQEQIDVICGTLLGDAWLETTTKGITCRYGFKQKKEQSDYLDHVFHILQNLCRSKPILNRTDYQFKTLTKNCLVSFDNLFYSYQQGKRKKIIPDSKTLYKLLTPRAFAYWFMDDGSKAKKRSSVLCTNCFTYDEVNLLCFVLNSKFGLKCHPYKQLQKTTNKIEWRIYFLTKTHKKLYALVEPYIVPTMLYKLPDLDK